MTIKVKALIDALKKLPGESELTISVDISDLPSEYGVRVFTHTMHDIQDNGGDYSLLLEGNFNEDLELIRAALKEQIGAEAMKKL